MKTKTYKIIFIYLFLYIFPLPILGFRTFWFCVVACCFVFCPSVSMASWWRGTRVADWQMMDKRQLPLVTSVGLFCHLQRYHELWDQRLAMFVGFLTHVSFCSRSRIVTSPGRRSDLWSPCSGGPRKALDCSAISRTLFFLLLEYFPFFPFLCSQWKVLLVERLLVSALGS